MRLDREFYYNEKLILEPAIPGIDRLHISESISIYRNRYWYLENVILVFNDKEVIF